MKNDAAEKFLKGLKAFSTQVTPHKPRFKVGDCIMLLFKDKRIISEVKEVILYKQEIKDYLGLMGRPSVGEYILKDLVNEHKTTPINEKYNNRSKDIHKIDSMYEQIDSKVAQVLYGKR